MKDDAPVRPSYAQGGHEPGVPVRVAVVALLVLCVVVAAVYVVLFAH